MRDARGWVGLRHCLAALALTQFLSTTLASCPTSCECKWRNGKQSVLCVDKGLRDIPEGLDHGSQVLDFSGNSVKSLAKERFETLGIVNLQRIYLARCGLQLISDTAFHGLTNLVELDLSVNNITAIPTNAFKDIPSLMRLTLSSNPIKLVSSQAFQSLSYLVNLELSNCAVEEVQDDAFAGLERLEWLRLDGNRIQSMRGVRILPKTLHGVDIHNNPWQCDCGMVDLRTWIKNYKNPLAMEPTCKGPPRLRGKLVRDLDDSDLACMPDVFPTTLYLEISEGKNVSLLCKVNATPEAKVSWWFQGSVLQNNTMVAPGVRLLYYLEEGKEEKKSELFIYNTNPDDNGTFACVAENPAGKAQANYTIRIIVKEEPPAEISGFPMEYVMALAGGMVVAVVLVCVSITVCVITCRKKRRKRRKEESGKAVALQTQASGKDGSNRLTAATGGSKINGTVFISDRSHHDLAAFAHPNAEGGTVAGEMADSYGQPVAKSYAVDQNPDLINDAESVGKDRRLKSAEDSGSYQEGSTVDDVPQPVWQDLRYPAPVPVVDMYHQPLSADVHLSAGRFLDSDGYPLDYGLPKLPLPHPGVVVNTRQVANLYRTLPHKPRAHASVSVRRYSREAEFLSRSNQNAYDPFHPPDVRYTADGYPTTAAPVPVSPGATLYPSPSSQVTSNVIEETLPSPPSAYKTDVSLPSPFPSSSCCVNQHCEQAQPLRCSVGAQTSEDLKTPCSQSTACLQPILTESPDEGYEGEGVDAEM